MMENLDNNKRNVTRRPIDLTTIFGAVRTELVETFYFLFLRTAFNVVVLKPWLLSTFKGT